VTLEEVDQAANRWNKLRNQDSHSTAGRLGVQSFAAYARRFLRFQGRLKTPRVHQPFSKYLDNFIGRCLPSGVSQQRPFAGGGTAPPTSSNGTEGGIGDFGRFD
jgi:hypothetical protein